MNEDYPNPMLLALGQRIRQLRTDHGYSQEAFADKCGVHRTFMGTIERGESNLSFQNIAKVATTLGITLSALFFEIEEKARGLTAKASSPVKTAKKRSALPSRPAAR